MEHGMILQDGVDPNDSKRQLQCRNLSVLLLCVVRVFPTVDPSHQYELITSDVYIKHMRKNLCIYFIEKTTTSLEPTKQ